MSDAAPSVRAARAGDSRTLALLALRNGRRRPAAGWALLAERDGVLLAAITLTSGTVLVNPSRAPGDAVQLLRLARYRILRQGGNAPGARSLLRQSWRRGLRTRSSRPAADEFSGVALSN